jgi:type I restriction enzyme R subunit
MPSIGDSERKTQNRVVKFFRDKLHYTYLGNLHDSENRNIMPERLHAWLLKQGYSEKIAAHAVDTLVKTSTNLQQGLYHANKEVYSLLKYGAKVKESVEQSPKTVYFIDFEDVSKNDFYIAEEVTIVSNNTKRPLCEWYCACGDRTEKEQRVRVQRHPAESDQPEIEFHRRFLYHHSVLHGR